MSVKWIHRNGNEEKSERKKKLRHCNSKSIDPFMDPTVNDTNSHFASLNKANRIDVLDDIYMIRNEQTDSFRLKRRRRKKILVSIQCL